MDDTTELLSTPLLPSTAAPPTPGGGSGPGALDDVSPLEQAVLDEYERLAENMRRLAQVMEELAGQPATETLDGLRELERKTSLVFTLLKASVYSIVLQHQIDGGVQ